MKRSIQLFIIVSVLITGLFASGSFARPVLKVSVFPFSPPLSFFSGHGEDKSVRGYTIDECVMLGKRLNCEVLFIPSSNPIKQMEQLKNANVSIVAHGSEKIAKSMGMEFIPVGISLNHHLYVHSSCKSVTCLKDLRDSTKKRIVTIRGAPYNITIPDSPEYVSAPTALEALELLDRGAADVFIAPSEKVADYLIDAHSLTNVRKIGVQTGKTALGFLVSKDHTELTLQIREAIAHLKESGNLQQLRDKWFGQNILKTNFKRYIKQLALALLIILVIFGAVIFWNMSLKRKVNEVTRSLQKTEKRYRNLIESSPDMIFLVNADGYILHANERACTNLSFASSAPKIHFHSLLVTEHKEEFFAFLKKIIHDGCDKFEFALLVPDADPLEVEIAGRMIQGTVEVEPLVCLFARNVTERNRMESELMQSERLAIIGKMAASVAHEINNPLGIIQANAEDLIYAGDINEETKEGLDAIQRNASRAGEILKDLLVLASPKPMTPELLNLSEVVDESVALLGPKIKTCTLEVSTPENPIYVYGDSRSLQQVLVNLILNAQGSIPDGGTIRVRYGCTYSETDPTARIIISDTGKGIPRDHLSNIFEPFFTSRKNGFGLGLFITRRIIERHNGIIYAESEVGKGTSMVIELPSALLDEVQAYA